jgi:hypothetical protein
MRVRRVLVPAVFLALLTTGTAAQQRAGRGADAITETDLKEWLTYIASDELQGRRTYSEGLGTAAGYISSHLKQWGVKPAGDGGTYLQVVKVQGIKVTSNASVTVDVNGQTRTFKDGEGITFTRQMGGKQTITGEDIVFAGYGLQIPDAKIDDYAETDPKGKIVIYMGPQGPANVPQGSFRLLSARGRNAVDKGAVAVISQGNPGFGGRGQNATPAPAPPAGRGGVPQVQPDFTTVQRFDNIITPQMSAQDEFLEFLFSGSDVKFAELKEAAAKRDPLPRFALKGVKMTINVDATYDAVRTQRTNNVVGIIEGTDPKLKDTYLAFGAHYDHIGYSEAPSIRTQGGTPNPGGCTGQVRPEPAPGDMINNGADDDGSGTVALMALAKAFATGQRPKRSLLFVWHAGEESGLLGSRFHADYPAVPLDKIVAQLNIDMIGRNHCDDPAKGNHVFVVGSDRISTELHNINEEANASLPKPLSLDYELNDPADPQSIYTRSDHYSYALKGIPIVFFFTGLHKDYHFVTDEVSKIEFPKLARVTQLVYATASRVANLDHAPARDNIGPRAGKGHSGKIKR